MMPSWPQLLILIAVVVLLFGTKKLRNIGSDLGAAIKGFKKAMNEDDEKENKSKHDQNVLNDQNSTSESDHTKKE